MPCMPPSRRHTAASMGSLNRRYTSACKALRKMSCCPSQFGQPYTDESRSQEELAAEVVARYPAAEAALSEEGILWAVEDENLSMEIQLYYEQLLEENATTRLQAIVARIEGKSLL